MKQWYYIDNNQQRGPISEEALIELLQKGILPPETLVWSESMREWTPSSEVDAFQAYMAPSPPPIPGTEAIIPIIKQAEKVQEEVVSQVRPWIRYWARLFDIFIFSLFLGFVLGIIAPSVLDIPEVFLTMLILVIWAFQESILFSNWGTTPGKWLLRIKLRDNMGKKLTFSNALNRSFSVWFRGLGMGVPIVTVITLIVAHGKLKQEGITTWDREGGYVVTHDKIGVLRSIVTISFFIVFFLLIIVGEAMEEGW